MLGATGWLIGVTRGKESGRVEGMGLGSCSPFLKFDPPERQEEGSQAEPHSHSHSPADGLWAVWWGKSDCERVTLPLSDLWPAASALGGVLNLSACRCPHLPDSPPHVGDRGLMQRKGEGSLCFPRAPVRRKGPTLLANTCLVTDTGAPTEYAVKATTWPSLAECKITCSLT